MKALTALGACRLPFARRLFGLTVGGLFFAPLLFAHLRVLDEEVERLAVAQSVGDATFAPLLCQGGPHLLNRLPLPFRDGLDFGVDLALRDLDILGLGDALQ